MRGGDPRGPIAAGGRLRGRDAECGGSAGRPGGCAALRGALLPLLEGGGTPFVCHPGAGEERGPRAAGSRPAPRGNVAVTGWLPHGWLLTSVLPAPGMASYTSGTFTSGMAAYTSGTATCTSGMATCLRNTYLRDGHLHLRDGHQPQEHFTQGHGYLRATATSGPQPLTSGPLVAAEPWPPEEPCSPQGQPVV